MRLVARIDVLPVDVDITAAVGMLDGIAARAAPGHLEGVIERVARDAMSRIVPGLAADSGELRRSVELQRRGNAIAIVATAPYARFVFRGTRYMSAQPPDVPADQIARELAADIAREVFR